MPLGRITIATLTIYTRKNEKYVIFSFGPRGGVERCMLSKSAGAIGVSIGQQVRIVRKNRDERFTLYYSVGNADKRYIYMPRWHPEPSERAFGFCIDTEACIFVFES